MPPITFFQISKNGERVFPEYFFAKNDVTRNIYCCCLQQKQFVSILGAIPDLYFFLRLVVIRRIHV